MDAEPLTVRNAHNNRTTNTERNQPMTTTNYPLSGYHIATITPGENHTFYLININERTYNPETGAIQTDTPIHSIIASPDDIDNLIADMQYVRNQANQ